MKVIKVSKNNRLIIFINDEKINLSKDDLVFFKSENEAYYNNQRIDTSNSSNRVYYISKYNTKTYTKIQYKERIQYEYIGCGFEQVSIHEYRDTQLNKLLDENFH